MGSIEDNLRRVEERIASAAGRAGIDPRDITLVAVTKTVPANTIREALSAGVREIGENRVREAWDKYRDIGRPPGVRWHMVGHLQRNKVKRALEIFDLIHSVDSLTLAQEIDSRAGRMGRAVDALIQVNISGEESKFGVPPSKVAHLIESIAKLEWIKVKGLMTIAPYVDDPEKARPVFRDLRRLRDSIAELSYPGVEMRYLSMGMSNDFEVAIEEGANMVRIGTAIFGERGR
ncbi:MAG: YggS family pyridoxal phosphate-dependent enzyme [bacterium]